MLLTISQYVRTNLVKNTAGLRVHHEMKDQSPENKGQPTIDAFQCTSIARVRHEYCKEHDTMSEDHCQYLDGGKIAINIVKVSG